LRGVDPAAGFLSAEEYKEFQKKAAAARADTGLTITRRGEHLTVVAARKDSPAERAGLGAGDGVLKLDGQDANDLQLWQAIDRLRGPAASAVTLTVRREGWPEPRQLDLTRAVREGASVSASDLGTGIIHLRVRWFDETTAGAITAALRPAAGGKVAGLVLDLRNTAEGELPPGLALLGLFLPKDEVAVVLDGRLIPLPDGSAVWLTTGRYVTPKGHAIDRKGITPDVVVDAPAQADADPQLERALQILKVAKIIGHYREGA